MDNLFKKLEELSDLLKEYQANIRIPKPPHTPALNKPAKMPGVPVRSKKNPVKVAEQPKTQEQMKPKTGKVQFTKLGQWAMQ